MLLSQAHADLGEFDDARGCINEALTAIQTNKERWCEAEVNRVAGEVALRSPEPNAAKAESYFERSLAVARQQQAKSWELRAAMSMARLWLRRRCSRLSQALPVTFSRCSQRCWRTQLKSAMPHLEISSDGMGRLFI